MLDFDFESICLGLTRGIIPTVFQSSQAVRTRIAKNASGNHVVAKSAAEWNQSPTICDLIGSRGGVP
jgi:hypothetical protein